MNTLRQLAAETPTIPTRTSWYLNDPHNKIHLIEETFQRLMFDTAQFTGL